MEGNDEPLVGVAVPAWQSGAFVRETLETVLSQSYRNLRIVVSVDGDDAETRRVCEEVLPDRRVEIVTQKERLGWVRNTAWALGAAAQGAAYACIVPHDDLLDEEYLAALVERARDRPDAAAVYADIEAFGTLYGPIVQPSVTGERVARMVAILLDHFSAVAWRGLIPIAVLDRVGPMRPNAAGDFAADTVWMTRLAAEGPLIRLPRALLRKRYHPGNAHRAWLKLNGRRLARTWTVHCLDMLAAAWPTATRAGERRLLVDAARLRLTDPPVHLSPFGEKVGALGRIEKVEMAARFRIGVARLAR